MRRVRRPDAADVVDPPRTRRRPGPRARARGDVRDLARVGEGQGRQELQGDRRRLVPRRHRRLDRRRDQCADRCADDRAEPRVRRRSTAARTRASTSSSWASRARTTPSGSTRAPTTKARARHEEGAPPRRLGRAQRLLDDGRPVPRLGLPARARDPRRRQYLDGDRHPTGRSMPGTSDTYADRYDLGYTLVHEAGHWLNLEHTFYGGCNAKGDFVDDTPAERTPTSRLPGGQGHLPRAGARPDPQLHGLLVRRLLRRSSPRDRTRASRTRGCSSARAGRSGSRGAGASPAPRASSLREDR